MTQTAVAQPLASGADAELVRAAGRGDSAAFERLVSDRAERAFRVARAILGEDADARDATQEAFVAAWRELPRLRDVKAFDAWFRRILVNACRAQQRNRRRVREISLGAAAFDKPAADFALADRVGDTDALARAFRRLDTDKRTILVLHYLDHQPVADVARALAVPVGTAKWRLSDARAALERALIAEGSPQR